MSKPQKNAIIDGPATRDGVIKFLSNLKFENDGRKIRWEFILRKWSPPRSDPQNAYLFGVCYPPLMEHMGLQGSEDLADLHAYFCIEFFGSFTKEIMGKKKIRPKRTTTTDEHGYRDVVDKQVFGDFIAMIQRKAAENGVYIPEPQQ